MAIKKISYGCSKCGYIQYSDFDVCPACGYSHSQMRDTWKNKKYTSTVKIDVRLKDYLEEKIEKTESRLKRYIDDKFNLGKKGQVGTAWIILLIGLLLVAFIMAVPPDYRLLILG